MLNSKKAITFRTFSYQDNKFHLGDFCSGIFGKILSITTKMWNITKYLLALRANKLSKIFNAITWNDVVVDKCRAPGYHTTGSPTKLVKFVFHLVLPREHVSLGYATDAGNIFLPRTIQIVYKVEILYWHKKIEITHIESWEIKYLVLYAHRWLLVCREHSTRRTLLFRMLYDKPYFNSDKNARHFKDSIFLIWGLAFWLPPFNK